jgi:hypothetical protein
MRISTVSSSRESLARVPVALMSMDFKSLLNDSSRLVLYVFNRHSNASRPITPGDKHLHLRLTSKPAVVRRFLIEVA